MTSRTNTSFCAALALWGILGPLRGGAPLAAPPSFELDLKDLETTKPAPKPRRQTTRLPRKESTPSEAPTAASISGTPDDNTRYTVKPGDFLFKILIRDFGLSNAQAERLIPEIQRLNKLSSATRLEVGQTILIPRPRQTPPLSSTAKATPSEAPVAVPPTVAPAPPVPPSAPSATVSPPSEPVTPKKPVTPEKALPAVPPSALIRESAIARQAIPQAPSSVAASSFSADLIRLWKILVPGQEQLAPPTVDGGILDPADYPLLLAADGGWILVDLRGTLPSQLRSQLIQKYPDIRIIARGTDSLKPFFSTLMKAAEFPRLEENVAVDLDVDPSLTIRADFRIARLPATKGGPETVLLFIDDRGPCLPPSLTDYLGRKGFQVAQFCGKAEDSSVEPGYELRTIPSSSPCDMAMSLLDALSLKLDRNRIVSGTMGTGSENRFSIRVEGYFESRGKRFILDCAGNDPYNYTLFRLLMVQGYGVVQPREKDNFGTVTEQLLTELNYPHTFGRHEVDYGRYRIAITGFKVTRRETSTGRLLITSRTSDPVFAELLRWKPQEKK